MRPSIEIVIYTYLFVCIALLFFNCFYILRTKQRKKRSERTAKRWQILIEKQMKRLAAGEQREAVHSLLMERKLVRIDQLVAYGTALEWLTEKEEKMTGKYVQANQGALQVLASRYSQKSSMERAYFCYLISRFLPYEGGEYRPLMEILISFLSNATIYCRENVLKALYALGNCQAVENAFQYLNDQLLFHHTKLLSDGLLTFSGDREKLAARLWSHYGEWNETLMLSVIQFISGFSGQYCKIFLTVLKTKGAGLEIRLAILRYFRRHVYEPVHSLLLSYLFEDGTEENIKIVTASVLACYPGRDTVKALKHTLHHPNWYVRYNSASSLAKLNTPPQALQDILHGEDRYAKEILEYMLEDGKGG